MLAKKFMDTIITSKLQQFDDTAFQYAIQKKVSGKKVLATAVSEPAHLSAAATGSLNLCNNRDVS